LKFLVRCKIDTALASPDSFAAVTGCAAVTKQGFPPRMSSVEDYVAAEPTTTKRMGGIGLIGDIGATNARFALVQPGGKTSAPRVYSLNDFPSLPDAIDSYLREEKSTERPVQAVLAVASPVTDNQVTLTNHPWTFSVEALRQQLGLRRLQVINDFAANAVAVPHLAPDDVLQVGGGVAVRNAPIGVIGPGTGLGVSAFVPSADGGAMIAGEGGHVTMAPATPQESALLDLMRSRFDHVSAERILSGPGLVNLYNALCELSDMPAASYSAEQITNPGIWNADPRTHEATAMFCAMLGTVAGNLALTLGARGGIYISGGIVPRMSAFFVQSEFRARFEAKGRLSDYVMAIPTYVITRPLPVLLGAAAMLHPDC
jgi:glucokinase